MWSGVQVTACRRCASQEEWANERKNWKERSARSTKERVAVLCGCVVGWVEHGFDDDDGAKQPSGVDDGQGSRQR